MPMKPPATLTDAELLTAAARAHAELPDAPSAWQQAAIGLWPSPLAQAAGAALRLVRGVLRFDSAASSPLALGMRSGGSAVRQWLFGADGHDVDLRSHPVAGAVRLSGQLLGPGQGGQAQLESPQWPVQAVPIDDEGAFDFGVLPPGRYQVVLQIEGLRIELPVVELGGSGD